MALWDRLFGKKDDDPRKLNPIVQKSPAPSSAPRASNARPAAKKVEEPAPPPAPEKGTKRKKKDPETASKRPKDEEAFLKRGMARQQQGDHDGAIEDFTKAIELNSGCAQAYASRGVSKERKGDTGGAKSDYSMSIQIELNAEISRQIRDNPEVDM
jgi:tetratricopeptide (TPR) repeat protein